MFIYLAVLGLGCSTWDFHCDLWGSVTVARALSVVACSLSCSMAWGILVPRPGIEPASPALQGGPNHWTTREVP